jgi:hypothetical protein
MITDVRRARALAGPRAGSYLAAAACLVLAACAPPRAPAPVGAFEPASPAAVAAMAAATMPVRRELVAIHWTYDEGDAPVTGRGAVRVAPPDSLRLDVAVPVIGRATVVLAGDSAWTQPRRLTQQLAPGRALLWAMFGVVQLPPGATGFERGVAAGGGELFRFTRPDGVVVTLELSRGRLMGATAERGTRTIGRLALTRGADGAIVRAETDDDEHGMRFIVTVDRREASGPFPDEIWRRP